MSEYVSSELYADTQEALSFRYVDALRVVFLSSGRWAVFPLAGGRNPEIMERLNEERMKEMLKVQDAERAELMAAIVPRRGKVLLSELDLEIEI